MKVKLYPLSSLIKDMARNQQDMEQFTVSYNNIAFDIVLDIGSTPFELMVGAVHHNWASVMEMHKGYEVEMPDKDYYALLRILNVKPNESHITSSKFLFYIASKAPTHCSNMIIQPTHITRFRAIHIKDADEPEKTVFKGWNNHVKDHKTAHNFEKTELLLGKRCADYCRAHNISSLWTTPDKAGEGCKAYYPWDNP